MCRQLKRERRLKCGWLHVVMFQGPAQLSIACSMRMDEESLGMKLPLSMGPYHLCFVAGSVAKTQIMKFLAIHPVRCCV